MQFAEETALVTRLEGDYVVLDTQRSSNCSNCVSESGCGAVANIFKRKPKKSLRVANTLDLKSGDSVIVGMSPSRLLLGSFLVYVFPLLLLFAFSGTAKLFLSETASIVMGVFGLFLGLWTIKVLMTRQYASHQFQPKLIRKIVPLAQGID